ncbi:MAG: hypothetical protein IE909_06275 [Campylobacterales bacterium]|nr:hypothetical protein [Campylobacterales bacterium]
MDKNQSYKFQQLHNQILSLDFSGVYFSTNDLLHIARKNGYNIPHKSREFILRELLNQSKNDAKIDLVYNDFISLLSTRIEKYKDLAMQFQSLKKLTNQWIFKATTLKKLITLQGKNPYE